MDMAALLDELTYRVLASADDGTDARARLAVITHWAAEQDARLAAGLRNLRLDSAEMVAEALDHPCNCGPENDFGPCPQANLITAVEPAQANDGHGGIPSGVSTHRP